MTKLIGPNPGSVVRKSILLMSLALAGVNAQAELSGNIGVFSKYVLRGITTTTENNGAVVQGGFDYAHESGLFAGYWGSSLSYAGADSNPSTDAEFENDFYAGWAGDVGAVNLNAGLIYYYYMDTEDANGFEFAGSVGAGPVTLGVKYLLEDVLWGNQGDTYVTLGASQALPSDFEVSATAGYYFYGDEGDFVAETAESSGFRHLDLSLAHPVGNTGADMSVTYIVGGDDRNGVRQEDTVVLGVKYGFDI
ncbi:MAG: hypothetical protein CME36_07800 [unclassified Hahellaceae]|nr:hypothetical protein [Hahellaceae bacterium]